MSGMKALIKELKENKTLHLMILPAIIFFIIFSYLPMVGIYYAFTDFTFKGGLFGSPFVGFKNFSIMFNTGVFFNLTKNTILYNLAFIIIGNGLQILTAITLSELTNKMFKKISQSMLFLPYFISYVMVGAFVYNLLNYDFGVVNGLLKSFSLQPVDFYSNPSYWKFIIVLAYLWKSLGYGTVIYLATITSIDREMYEAADIDGAGKLKQIYYITLPMLKPTFIILFLFSIGGILRGQFDLFWQLVGSNGYLFNATDIIDTFVYRTLRQSFSLGLGSAVGVYQSFFGFVIVMAANYIIKRNNEDYALF